MGPCRDQLRDLPQGQGGNGYCFVSILMGETTELADELEELNPGFAARAEAIGGIAVAPDADAMVEETSSFRYVDCPPLWRHAQARHRVLR